jgi:hypothetical protein
MVQKMSFPLKIQLEKNVPEKIFLEIADNFLKRKIKCNKIFHFHFYFLHLCKKLICTQKKG